VCKFPYGKFIPGVPEKWIGLSQQLSSGNFMNIFFCFSFGKSKGKCNHKTREKKGKKGLTDTFKPKHHSQLSLQKQKKGKKGLTDTFKPKHHSQLSLCKTKKREKGLTDTFKPKHHSLSLHKTKKKGKRDLLILSNQSIIHNFLSQNKKKEKKGTY